MNRTERFSSIYRTNWFQGAESRSGTGSSDVQTVFFRRELVRLCRKLGVKVLLDVCGDCHWMSKTWGDLCPYVEKYVGMDIVPEVISQNASRYSLDRVSFICKDIVSSPLPDGDMLLCRDVLVHLSSESTLKFLRNFASSNIKWLLTTTFVDAKRTNIEFEDGTGWYAINLTSPPFNLPRPEEMINERCTEHDGAYGDKSMGLWARSSLCGI